MSETMEERLRRMASTVRSAALAWADAHSAPVPDEWWSAAQVYEDAAAEIARLTAELDAARERERGAYRAFEVAMEHVHESLYGDILVRLAEEGIDLTALATPQEASDG